MILTLNGYKLNDITDPTTVAWLDKSPGIQGLEIPTARTSTGNYAGRLGGWIGAQYFSARDITIPGHIFSGNVATHEAARAALQQAVTNQTVTVNITTNAGNQYTIYANFLDFQMPWADIFKSNFKLELFAGDPLIYATGSNETISLAPALSGGVIWPITWPLTYSAGSAPSTLVNTGSVPVNPTITLTGTMTNPILTNLTTGAFMGLNIVTGPSDTVVISMSQHTILLDGSSIFGDQQAGSSFWYLATGSNAIQLSTASTSDTVTGSASWQSGVMGI